MRKKVLPFMALSYEAFCECIQHKVEVIYVDMQIYKDHKDAIVQQLEENGYNPTEYIARKGIFFGRGIDVSCCEIEDPYRLF